MRYFLVFLFSLFFVCADAQDDFPCTAITTTTLNVRSGPGTSYRQIGQFRNNAEVYVMAPSNNGWVQIRYASGKGFVSSRYLRFKSISQQNQHTSQSVVNDSGRWNFWSIAWNIFLFLIGGYFLCVFLFIAYRVITVAFGLGIMLTDLAIRIICFPFFFLNGCQRYLAKPWFVFLRRNHFSDSVNKVLRVVFSVLKIPFYILLLPVRLVNAIFFNLILHVGFEMFNYLMEVFFPTDWDEGYYSTKEWILYLPIRILKYPVYHGSLTVIESIIWTVADCIFPALTLYHGTDPEAAENIVAHPDRGGWHGTNSGLWIVGGGNYAGNGIYFAPARSTAEHYSCGSLIVCRVTLGRTLDLGIAPRRVYEACGYPDALEVTRWGLNHDYVTGEWWRGDARWWEYCMYDWQNRYNFSWRIRPLYVMNLSNRVIQRIPGGMSHWLFRRVVCKDIFTTLNS